MSHSFRKTPAFAMTGCASEKADKRIAHKTLRAHFRTQLNTASDLEDFFFDERSVAHSNVYDFGKDGRYFEADFRAARIGNKLILVQTPGWVRGVREARQYLGK